MHKRRTQLARRVNRVASVVEGRGVRATYGVHDRFLSNRRARARFRGATPTLDDTQQRVLSELRTEGYSFLRLADLVPDAWETLATDGDRFIAQTEEGLAREAAGEEGGLRR